MWMAAPWYESSSFWQFVITTLVAVAVGALGAFATMRASNPKRRLDYAALVNASLFAASHRQSSDLAVTYTGTPVGRPRIIELVLANAGRRDITAAQFHGGDPIKYDLGAEVVAVLEVSSSPPGTVAPNVAVAPSSRQVIQIPPSLLVRKQRVRVTVLVDGPRADVECLAAPLVDVTVRDAGEAGVARDRMRGFVVGVASTVALMGMLLNGIWGLLRK